MSGFVSSGFSVGAGEGATGAFKMAIIGGTVSEIGGGKFANGARGSAFQYLFNEYMTQAEVKEMRATYKNPDKVAFGNRTTQWHKENGEVAMAMMGAGTVMVGAGIAIEATYTYMYFHPLETVTVIGIADNLFLGGTPPNSWKEFGATILHDYNPWVVK